MHYAHKLTTTRRALEKVLSRPWSGAGGCQQPSRSPLIILSFVKEHFGPICLLLINWCRERLPACISLLFFSFLSCPYICVTPMWLGLSACHRFALAGTHKDSCSMCAALPCAVHAQHAHPAHAWRTGCIWGTRLCDLQFR